MEKKIYPLIVSQEIEKLFKIFRSLVSENSDIITKIEKDGLIYIVDKEKEDFYFHIYQPAQNKEQIPVFSYNYLPENGNNFQFHTRISTLDIIIDHFSNWISLLRAYNAINFSEDEKMEKFYENEYYHEFKLLDEDADINPFNEKQQIFLYEFLSIVSDKLAMNESNDPKLLEIISETNNLRDNIQKLNKRELMRRMSKVFGKLKKFSLKLTLDVFDVVKKEAIKKVLYGGINEVGNLVQGLS